MFAIKQTQKFFSFSLTFFCKFSGTFALAAEEKRERKKILSDVTVELIQKLFVYSEQHIRQRASIPWNVFIVSID